MIKSIKYWLFSGTLLVFSASCAGKLEVEPTQSISETAALATEKDVLVTLVGAYDGLSDQDIYGGGFQFTTELMGDDREVVFGGTFKSVNKLTL